MSNFLVGRLLTVDCFFCMILIGNLFTYTALTNGLFDLRQDLIFKLMQMLQRILLVKSLKIINVHCVLFIMTVLYCILQHIFKIFTVPGKSYYSAIIWVFPVSHWTSKTEKTCSSYQVSMWSSIWTQEHTTSQFCFNLALNNCSAAIAELCRQKRQMLLMLSQHVMFYSNPTAYHIIILPK